MRVAIVSHMRGHFECIGPFADVINSSIVTIYIAHNKLNWLNFLTNRYPKVIHRKFHVALEHSLYDWIICPTETDHDITLELEKTCPEKLILLEHIDNEPRCTNSKARLYLSTRFFDQRDNNNNNVFFPLSNQIIRDVAHKTFTWQRRYVARDKRFSMDNIYIALVGSALGSDDAILHRLLTNYPAKIVFLFQIHVTHKRYIGWLLRVISY
jgi:hypothetical protein